MMPGVILRSVSKIEKGRKRRSYFIGLRNL
jgi:hypothetical protein